MARMQEIAFTTHGLTRMYSRRIPLAGVRAALRWGRRWHHAGCLVYRLDRRTLARARANGVDVTRFEGIVVVLSLCSVVVTVYRNRRGERVPR